MTYRFSYADTGNFRTYYLDGRRLYCIQNDGSWGRDRFVFYACSRDGEPSHECGMPPDSHFDRKVMPDTLERKP